MAATCNGARAPVSSGTDQCWPVLATAVGTYSDSKMLVSALVLALAMVTGLSLSDAGWLLI